MSLDLVLVPLDFVGIGNPRGAHRNRCVRHFLSAVLVATFSEVRARDEISAHLRFLSALFPSPFARVRAAVHVQYFTRGERGVSEKQSGVDDFFDLTDPANRVQPFEEVMIFRFMHRRIDHSRRYGVYTDALFRVLNERPLLVLRSVGQPTS